MPVRITDCYTPALQNLRKKSKYFDYFRRFCTFTEIFNAMKRKIEQKLINWKNNPNRMPLIVNGARQTGKTYSVLEFGLKNYQNVVHINLEKNKLAATEFEGDISPEVDFIVQDGIHIVPIEVNKGKRNRAISLSNFVKQYKCPYSIRISQKNFGFENNIKSVPFYALFNLCF
jgi:predicted AAA+ superfamily ATPase